MCLISIGINKRYYILISEQTVDIIVLPHKIHIMISILQIPEFSNNGLYFFNECVTRMITFDF